MNVLISDSIFQIKSKLNERLQKYNNCSNQATASHLIFVII